MKTYPFGQWPTTWTKGPVEITYDPSYRRADGSPVLSQSTGVFGLGATDYVRWLVSPEGDGQMMTQSHVMSCAEIIANADGLNPGSVREKLREHGCVDPDQAPDEPLPTYEVEGETASGDVPGLGGA
jgi:hypothetical protein